MCSVYPSRDLSARTERTAFSVKGFDTGFETGYTGVFCSHFACNAAMASVAVFRIVMTAAMQACVSSLISYLLSCDHPILGRSDHHSLSQPFRHRSDGHQHHAVFLDALMFTRTPILSFIHF